MAQGWHRWGGRWANPRPQTVGIDLARTRGLVAGHMAQPTWLNCVSGGRLAPVGYWGLGGGGS